MVSLHAGAGPTLDDQPNIEWPFREPIRGTYEAFRSYFHFWVASQVLGGGGVHCRVPKAMILSGE